MGQKLVPLARHVDAYKGTTEISLRTYPVGFLRWKHDLPASAVYLNNSDRDSSGRVEGKQLLGPNIAQILSFVTGL